MSYDRGELNHNTTSKAQKQEKSEIQAKVFLPHLQKEHELVLVGGQGSLPGRSITRVTEGAQATVRGAEALTEAER